MNPILDYHQRIFLCSVKLLIEQQLRGLFINQQVLSACYSELTRDIQTSMDSFLKHPLVAPQVSAYDNEVRLAWKRAEPPQFNKDGVTQSKRWEAWRAREARWMQEKGFNSNSKTQLRWLFFDRLGHKVILRTESKLPSVSQKVLPALGEPGKLLAKYNKLVKRQGYVARVIEKSARDGLLHPQFNTVGTVTGRLSGSGKLNLQQMPKVASFLEAFQARKGFKLIQADAEALEPTVLAEFSRDKSLWQIYGPGAPVNDIYLFTAAKIPALGREIRKHYDPDHPTPDGIAAAKKHCKKDRQIAKVVVLSAAYLAGPDTIHETLQLAGIDITIREVREIHREYWRLFAGVKKFEEQLKDIWANNKGWIPSVLGTPICIDGSKIKDIVNRFNQLSGHQILQLWIYHIDRLRTERKVVMFPYLLDNHDETVWEAPDAHVDAAKRVLEDALAATNDELGMEIKIRAPVQIATSLAEIKDPDGYETLLALRRAAQEAYRREFDS